MKRLIILLCATALIFGLLSGCSKKEEEEISVIAVTEEYEEAPATPMPEAIPDDEIVTIDPDHRPTVDDSFFPIRFEDGNTGGFTGRGEESVTVSDSYAYEGERALFVSERTQSWNGATIDVTKYILPMVEYEFSCYVYLPEGGSADIMLSAQTDYQGTSNYKQLSGSLAKVTVNEGEWTLMTGIVTFEGFDAAHLYIETGGASTASYYVDEVYLYRVGGDTDLTPEDLPSLKDVYADYFLIGTAGELNLFNEDAPSYHVVTNQFNAVTAENSMKPSSLQNVKGEFTFAGADSLVAAAKSNGMTMIGHTLAWHQQSPSWMNDSTVSREEAIENLKTHIYEVVTHFGDNIYSWDVVNEIFSDSITDPADWRGALRDCPWKTAIGDDYVEIAFIAAREANPNIILYYNDYNLDNESKREAVYHMAKDFIERGVPIDGIGMQGHYSMNTSAAAVELSIERFKELGIRISITELDVTYNGAGDSLTEEQEIEQAVKYAELFQVFKAHSDVIERVTLWGVSDGSSWRADGFPLLFDRYYKAKQSFRAVLDPDKYLAENIIVRVLPDAKLAKAVYGTPQIGGDDSQWDAASDIAVDSYVMAWEGAKGTARVLWDEKGLYVLMNVSDGTLNNSANETYNRDSIEIFVDENNEKATSFQPDDTQTRVSYTNEVSHNPNPVPKNGTVISDAKITGEGYTIQVFIPFQTIEGAKGTVIGFDLQINDANENGQRISIAKWNDITDDSWRNTEKLGNLELE